MSSTSYLKYIARTPTLFDDGEPISVARAQYLHNNLDHLYDQSSQVRISWVSQVLSGGDDDSINNGHDQAWWVGHFAWTPRKSGMPFNADLRVATATNNASYTTSVEARWLPVGASDFDSGDLGITEFAKWTGSGTTSTTGAWTIESQKSWSAVGPGIAGLFASCKRKYPIAEGGIGHQSEVYLCKLAIHATSSSAASGHAIICGVQLREYA